MDCLPCRASTLDYRRFYGNCRHRLHIQLTIGSACRLGGDPHRRNHVGGCLGALTFWSVERSLPLFWILLAWLLIWSVLDTNDNHHVRHLDLATTPAPQRPAPPPMEETFKQWLDLRSDAPAYAGKPYPVVLISAEGGGIYAAYHAAMALAELQDTQPAFSQHVFAISGVSGGSVGAALFASLIADRSPVSVVAHANGLNANGPVGGATSTFFDPDFLAPLVAKAFYPDCCSGSMCSPLMPQIARALLSKVLRGPGITCKRKAEQRRPPTASIPGSTTCIPIFFTAPRRPAVEHDGG